MSWKITLFVPDFTENDLQAVCKPIQDAWLTMGSKTQEFETRFAEIIKAKHTFAVSNGTSALQLGLAALDIKPGDEVLVPSLTFVACANSIIAQGAKPVFVDVADESDWTISPEDIRRKITPKTKAIMLVHYAGFPCRMDEIKNIANEYNLRIIEDSAHAVVTSLNGQYCGTMGDVGAFSFFSNKNITTGEGGMVSTNDDTLAERIRRMRSHGMTTLTLDRHKGRAISYDVVETGYNVRIDEIRSCLGLSQLERLDTILQKRRAIYKHYVEKLRDVDELTIPFLDHDHHTVGIHIFPILLHATLNRNEFITCMKEKGIQTSIHYPPIHQFSAYRKILDREAACPLTESIAEHEVTLPFYPSMKDEDVNLVCTSIKECLAMMK